MKNLKITFLGLAAAAISLTACSDVEKFTPDTTEQINHKLLTLTADMPSVNDGTRTELGHNTDGSVYPMWSYSYDDMNENLHKDYLQVYFEGQTRRYKFEVQGDIPSVKATFKEVLPQGTTTTLAEDLKDKGDVDVYFYYSQNPSYHEDFLIRSEATGMTHKTNSLPSTTDMLLSAPVKASQITASSGNSNINLRFKRMVGLVRIYLIEGPGVDLTTDYPSAIDLSLVEDKNPAIDIPNLGGSFTVDPTTGVLTPEENVGASVFTMDEKGNILPVVKTGLDGYPAYLCLKPYKLEEGQKMYLHALNKESKLQFNKVLTVPAGGIEFKAGEITTFKVTINKEDIIEYKENEIITVKAGSLTPELVQKKLASAVSLDDDLIISGPINAQDLEYLRQAYTVTDKDEYYLDLTNARIVADNTTLTGTNGEKIMITEDDVLPAGIINGWTNLFTLYLPNSLKTIKTGAIVGNPNLYNIRFGASLSTVETQAIELCTVTSSNGNLNHRLSLKINTPADVLYGGLADKFCKNDLVHYLYINESWVGKDGLNSGLDYFVWKGTKWESVW